MNTTELKELDAEIAKEVAILPEEAASARALFQKARAGIGATLHATPRDREPDFVSCGHIESYLNAARDAASTLYAARTKKKSGKKKSGKK